MQRRFDLLALDLTACALACLVAAAGLASAQAQPAAPPPAQAQEPTQDAAKRAFEALPEADRITMQDGLIWTGDYKGVADGKFGKGTRDAIAAFATRNKLPADGTLDAQGRGMLGSIAKQAKDNLRFLVQADARSGIQIGLPLKLLTKSKPLPSGTRYSSADESFSVETSTQALPAGGLPESYAALTADIPGRKVTYKVIRPDFFVVTGETASGPFYTRMARGEKAGNPTMAGYTITYPTAAKARFDPIAIAVANSFVPFLEAAPVAPTAVPQAGSATPIQSASPIADAGQANRPVLTATGIAVAPGLVLTSLPAACSEPTISGKKARIAKPADADGLTLLAPQDAPRATLALRAGDAASAKETIVLAYMPRGTAEELTGASGEIHQLDAGAWRLRAAVQNPVAGGAILDRSGALVGLLASSSGPGKPVAGVLPQSNRSFVPSAKIAAFLADTRPKTADSTVNHSAGEIVAVARAALLPVYCPR